MRIDLSVGGQVKGFDGKWYRLLDYIPNPNTDSLVKGWGKRGEELIDDRV